MISAGQISAWLLCVSECECERERERASGESAKVRRCAAAVIGRPPQREVTNNGPNNKDELVASVCEFNSRQYINILISK